MARKPSKDPATAYARDVVKGRIVAGKFVRLACERHLRDLEEGPARGLRWDSKSAARALGFFPAVLSITAGAKAGEPFDPLPWHTFVAGNLFGWRKESGRLRFRRAWIETGKGQAKSPLMAALGLYMMGFYGVPRAEIYAIGQDKNTANVLFRDAVAMCRAPIPAGEEGETLEARGEVIIRGEGDNSWKVEHPESGSKFQSLANGEAISGPRPVAVLADEIHEFKSAHPIETWQRAIAKMPGDGMMILGTNTPDTTQIVGTNYSESFQRVLKGDYVDDEAFAYIARVDEADHERVFDDESVWKKSLPALGITFPLENVRGEVNTARTLLSTALSVKRLYFGIPVGVTGFWIAEHAWRAVQGKVDREALRGRKCWLSLDLSQKNDLTALSAAFEPADDGEPLEVVTWYWTTKDGLADRSKADNAPYDLWVAQGDLEAVPGAVIDKGWVAQKVAELCATYDVQELVFDPAGIADFVHACGEIGLPVWTFEGPDEPAGEGLKLVRHAQGTRVMFQEKQHCMPRSIARLEDVILNDRVVIDVSPVTTACAANAVLITDPQRNRAFDKKRSRGRIDGLVTIAMAVGAATAHEAELPVSAYDRLGAEDAEIEAGQVAARPLADDGSINYDALKDPSHPLFATMKARFDEHMALTDDGDY
jgi:phage terminase large subunit-like protein